MSAHTPGPWHIAGRATIRQGEDNWIASVNWFNRAPNARLIAAAPDLLSALSECHEIMHRCTAVLSARDCEEVAATMTKARDAIALATGETPR